MKIRTNNVPRPTLCWADLTSKERIAFDYLTPEVWMCDDCTVALVNGDYSGMDDGRAAEVGDAVRRMGWVAENFDSETEDGILEFSRNSCDCCGTNLAGSRHRFCDFAPTESASFVRYKGTVYHLDDFMTLHGAQCAGITPQMREAGFLRWNRYAGDSFFSGVLARYVGSDCDHVVMGEYFT